MKERPILFSAPMVRALLGGSKTQTRRVVKPQPTMYEPGQCVGVSDMINDSLICPYGQPGDRLWVRETHRAIWGQSPGYLIGVDYKADPQEKWERMRDHMDRPQWTPSIHMRREYSRILLEIISVRVERLQDINGRDASAEGAPRYACDGPHCPDGENGCNARGCAGAREWYEELWNEINGAGSCAANPWVWVVEFKRVVS